MFYHVKELQYNARVSKPDPRFANLLLEQFGGANGELKAAMDYFIQAFGAKQPHPDKYDMLMDIATEEFSHLEIVGATIQMLLTGIKGELKNAADESEITRLLDGNASKESILHEAMSNPQVLTVSGGSPMLTNSAGVPWTAAYLNATGDLTVDLRSNMAAESRAKIVYEYLMKFTDDPYVKDTLNFLMVREVAHYQMFEAALSTIQSNFPPGVLQADPRYSNKYFNMSSGGDYKGPWNEGKSTGLGETWQFIEDPIQHVLNTQGLKNEQVEGTSRTIEKTKELDKKMSKLRSEEISEASPVKDIQWSSYSERQAMVSNGNGKHS
jgi:Mn-containing catalase